jgi:hypothetical protein
LRWLHHLFHHEEYAKRRHLAKFTKVQKIPKEPFFQGNPCKNFQMGFFSDVIFLLLPGTGKPPTCSRLLPTRAD